MNEPTPLHNFDAVNAFVEREQLRSLELLRDARARRWDVWSWVAIRIAAGVAVLVLAIGVIVWLFHLDTSEAFQVYRIGAEGADERFASIEAALHGIQSDLTMIQSDQVRRDREMVSRFEASGGDGARIAGVEVDYTIFETVWIEDGGQIVTGRIYDPSNTEAPRSEYCYHDDGSAGVRHITNYLASRDRGEAIEWHSSAPARLIALGKRYCRFR